jgi:hypothetical protein
LILAALVLILAVVVLTGCAEVDNAAARRAAAESSLETARAQAYAERVRADSQAAGERSLVRQAERDAAHQRVLELLPFLALIIGGLVLVGFAGLVFWDLRRQSVVTDAVLFLALQRWRLEQSERDAALWQAIAQLDRRSLPARDDRSPVVTIERRR